MDRFIIRTPAKWVNGSSQDSLDEQPQKRVSHKPSSLQKYKDKLTYNPSWKNEHPWMDCMTQPKMRIVCFSKLLIIHKYSLEVYGLLTTG